MLAFWGLIYSVAWITVHGLPLHARCLLGSDTIVEGAFQTDLVAMSLEARIQYRLPKCVFAYDVIDQICRTMRRRWYALNYLIVSGFLSNSYHLSYRTQRRVGRWSF